MTASVSVFGGKAEAPLRLIAFFDGQNFLKTANEVCQVRKQRWDYDPRLLVAMAQRRIAVQLDATIIVAQTRFYTGVPRHDKDALGRGYWEKLFARFHNDGITVTSRQLKYRGDDAYGREKGIDLRIGLDLVRMVVEDACDVVLLFSQDTDLREAIIEAKRLLKREGDLTGRRRFVHFFSAYPKNMDPKTNHWIMGTTPLGMAANDVLSAEYPKPPSVDASVALAALERVRRKKAVRNFDLSTAGGYYVGILVGVLPAQDCVVLVLETRTDLLEIVAHPDCFDRCHQFLDRNVDVYYRGGVVGNVIVEVRGRP